MASNFLLTIVTVTKNCFSTIERTLLSVEKIKSNQIEFVVIDGCSDDGTLNIIESYRHIVDCLVSEIDSGVYSAMNKGVCLANGDYILFLGGDDELLADNFTQFINLLKQSSADIFSGITLIESHDGNFSHFIPNPYRLLFLCSVPHTSSCVSSKLLKKNLFREDLRIASDYDLFLRLFLKFKRFEIVDIPISRHYAGGISRNIELNIKEVDVVRKTRLRFMYYLLLFAHKLYTPLKNFFK